MSLQFYGDQGLDQKHEVAYRRMADSALGHACLSNTNQSDSPIPHHFCGQALDAGAQVVLGSHGGVRDAVKHVTHTLLRGVDAAAPIDDRCRPRPEADGDREDTKRGISSAYVIVAGIPLAYRHLPRRGMGCLAMKTALTEVNPSAWRSLRETTQRMNIRSGGIGESGQRDEWGQEFGQDRGGADDSRSC